MAVPIDIENDPRKPPVGRILGGQLRVLEGGQLGLVGHLELFEEGDVPEYLGHDREMPLGWRPIGGFSIEHDRNFRDPADQGEVSQLAEILNAKPEEFVKKSLDPIGLLILGMGCLFEAKGGPQAPLLT
jgi:hypothetical protein